jgi:hypothetical protein
MEGGIVSIPPPQDLLKIKVAGKKEIYQILIII